MPIKTEDMLAILKAVRDQEIRAHEAGRAQAILRSPAAVSAALSREAQILTSLRHAIATVDRAVAMPLLIDAAERLGIDLQDRDPEMFNLAHKTMRLLVEISGERARRESGDYGSASVIEEMSAARQPTYIASPAEDRIPPTPICNIPSIGIPYAARRRRKASTRYRE